MHSIAVEEFDKLGEFFFFLLMLEFTADGTATVACESC